MRLQKFLSMSGIASRRKAEELIAAGRININGETVTLMGVTVDTEKDVVIYDGQEVKPIKEKVYIMLHKPEGYITTLDDQFGRPTILDLIEEQHERLYPVGRLDYDTSGLLLMTNDGELTYRLTHPKHNVEKVYVAKIVGTPTKQEMEAFRSGLDIGGETTAPAKIEIIKVQGTHTSVRITIHEGRNRQVRRMCEAINHEVASLKRIATGNLFLGDLPKGRYRKLNPSEIGYLKKIAGLV